MYTVDKVECFLLASYKRPTFAQTHSRKLGVIDVTCVGTYICTPIKRTEAKAAFVSQSELFQRHSDREEVVVLLLFLLASSSFLNSLSLSLTLYLMLDSQLTRGINKQSQQRNLFVIISIFFFFRYTRADDRISSTLIENENI